jgi:hypothetical protein
VIEPRASMGVATDFQPIDGFNPTDQYGQLRFS